MMLRSVMVAVAGLLMAGGVSAWGQQVFVHPESLACGAGKTKFDVKADSGAVVEPPIPAGKARVYVVESMWIQPFLPTAVSIGMDGTWLGATKADTHMTFFVTPGVHHLCAEFEREGLSGGMDEEGRVLLLRLNAEAGKTYYISYHGMSLREQPNVATFGFVDEDEGEYLVERTLPAVWKAK